MATTQDEIEIPRDIDGPPPPGFTGPVVTPAPNTNRSTSLNTGRTPAPNPGSARQAAPQSASQPVEHRVVIQVEQTPLDRANTIARFDYNWSGPPDDDWMGPPIGSPSPPAPSTPTRAERKKNAPSFEPLRLSSTRITSRGIEVRCHEGRLTGCLRFLLTCAGAVLSAIIWIAMLKARQFDLRWNNVAAFVGLVTINVASTFWCVIHIPINCTYIIYREYPCSLCCGYMGFLIDCAIALLYFAAASAAVGVTQYTRLPGGLCANLTEKDAGRRRYCNRTGGATGLAFINWAFIILPLAILSSYSLGRKMAAIRRRRQRNASYE